jgi:small-conductance mechanosensitive channel/CRP-like cAMP-binding protein
MSSTIIPVAILIVVTVVGILIFRRFPLRVRIAVDALCFAAVTIYFVWHGILPIFPPLGGNGDITAFSLRAIGGAWWVLAARLLVATLWVALHRDRRSREARLFSDLTAAAIYIATGMIILNSVFALPITGLVATSGVVAIVLGLALQNTLADVFSGIAVGIEAPFRVGDRIQIGENLEGQVVQVNWRSIWLLTDGDDVAIIPNSLVAKADIVNRSFPTERRAASVEISCPERAPPERVIDTLQQATLLCPEIVRIPAPKAVITGLGPERHQYQISFSVAKSTQLGSTKDSLLRAVRRQLHYAGLLDSQPPAQGITAELRDAALLPRQLLRDLVLFECLTDKQIDAVVEHLVCRRLGSGDALFKQNDTDTSMYVIASGILEITRKVGEMSETIGYLGAGEYVGEIGLLTGAAHAATATARGPCVIYLLPHDAIAPLLKQSEELASALALSVRRGLDALHREVAVRATPDVGGASQILMSIRNFFGFHSA